MESDFASRPVGRPALLQHMCGDAEVPRKRFSSNTEDSSSAKTIYFFWIRMTKNPANF